MSLTGQKIEFVLTGMVAGVEITPKTIGLGRFSAFNSEVSNFVAGSDRKDLNDICVSVETSSYKLVLSAIAFSGSLLQDMRELERYDSLGDINPKRAKVVEKWQKSSKVEPDIYYSIRAGELDIKPIRIGSSTNYHRSDESPWVRVEKYLLGEVVDIGGANSANVHVRLDDSNELITIGTNQEFLREQKINRLYRKMLVRVEADQHCETGKMKNFRLLSFEDYDPHYDEEALDKFAAAGREAWKDIPDHVAWVRSLRGGD